MELGAHTFFFFGFLFSVLFRDLVRVRNKVRLIVTFFFYLWRTVSVRTTGVGHLCAGEVKVIASANRTRVAIKLSQDNFHESCSCARGPRFNFIALLYRDLDYVRKHLLIFSATF